MKTKPTPAQIRYLRRARERCDAVGSGGWFIGLNRAGGIHSGRVCERNGWIVCTLERELVCAFNNIFEITDLGRSVLAEAEQGADTDD